MERTAGGDQNSGLTAEQKKQLKKERRKAKVSGKATQSTTQSFPGTDASSSNVLQKSKAELRAERRAKQEADRAAKAAMKAEQTSGGSKLKGPQVPANIQADDPKVQKKAAKKLEKQQVPQRAEGQKKVALFSHLHQYERSLSITSNMGFGNTGIHPAIIQLGLQYAEGLITGSNARCAALISAVCRVIKDYVTPQHKELSRDLEMKLKPAISYLNQCRPLSVSMGSAIKFMKLQISVCRKMSDSEAKSRLVDSLREFVRVNIVLAGKAISDSACTKISDGDVVMIYGNSSLITRVLCDAHKVGRNFRVVVVDSRPKLAGRGALRRLRQAGIQCSYVLVSAASYIMPEVTKVVLGAHGLLSNGYVMGSVGTSMVAMAAKACGVPVIVCCEAYKFCERVQADSFVNNEIGDPRDLLVKTNSHKSNPSLLDEEDWKQMDSLKVLHLTYDVTPPDYVAMVVTELGKIPCTSVPVVLRVRSTDT
uniref:Translation initiation factor eIF2B subunit delta n=1 Tax=Phallusia mammillata TaxID=59560 RepID=A0A6F9DCA8_9ASCI|nr:translation initiation factor eIF-2B subunit delta-like [Phallusia mammillata]